MRGGLLAMVGAGCFSCSSTSPPHEGTDAAVHDAASSFESGSFDSSTGPDAQAGEDAALDSASPDSPGSDAPTGLDAGDAATETSTIQDAGEPQDASEASSVEDAGSDGAPTDAASEAEAGPVNDAAVTCSGPADGGVCNTFANIGSMVTAGCGSVPAATGGTIVDGTYVLTAVTFYGSSCSGDASVAIPVGSETLVGSGLDTGGCLHEIFLNAGGDVTNTTSICSTQGIQYTCSEVCPAGDAGAVTQQYTATPTTLTVYSSNADGPYAGTYTKQ